MKKRILSLAMVLAMLAVMALPMAALAVTTDVTGTQAKTATLTKPTDITTWAGVGSDTTFGVGANTGNSGTPGSVVSNTANWTLTVSDTKTLATGYMTIGGADNVSLELAAPILVGISSGSGTIAQYLTALQGSGSGSTAYAAAGTFSIPLYVSQTVAAADPVGSYEITLTYVATPAA